MPAVSAENEWSPLRSVIVGRAGGSCFPSEPTHMIRATMPQKFHPLFRPDHPFPESILKRADEELDHLASLLEQEGIQVHRPTMVDWTKVGGYTGAMPRDGLMTVGQSIIESPFAWKCRRHEIELAYTEILGELAKDSSVSVVRASQVPPKDSIYDNITAESVDLGGWAINNSRPAFDCADFMRFGKTLIGQISNVTNMKGVEYLRSVIPDGYSVEILDVNDPHAMHIDATILPLRPGLLVYNPERVTDKALRKIQTLQDWDLRPYPFKPAASASSAPSSSSGPNQPPPLFMTSPWLVMNILSIDEKRVIVEKDDEEFAGWLEKSLGIKAILCPFRHVNSIGGSFHCATVDLVRQ